MGKVMLEVRNLKTKYVTRFHEDVYAVDGVSFKIKFIKPKQAAKASADPDDYDFEDEEDYINEDEPEQEEETEETK